MLELRLLQAHTERCPSCARVAADIGAISEAIRSAPLEPPAARVALPVVPHRGILDRVPPVLALGRIAAVAAVGLFAFTLGSRSSDQVTSAVPPRPIVIDETTLPSAEADLAELRAFRRAALLSETSSGQRTVVRPGPQAL
jgi:anti-sigma factor RsiW